MAPASRMMESSAVSSNSISTMPRAPRPCRTGGSRRSRTLLAEVGLRLAHLVLQPRQVRRARLLREPLDGRAQQLERGVLVAAHAREVHLGVALARPSRSSIDALVGEVAQQLAEAPEPVVRPR